MSALAAPPMPGPAASPVPPRAPLDLPADDLSVRVHDLVARACGRPAHQVRPSDELDLDLGLDSLERVELAALIEDELGLALPDHEPTGPRTVADLVAALAAAGPPTIPASLPTWPRQAPAARARALLQHGLLFPAVHRVCRPLRVRHAERLRELRGPLLIVANHTSHLDSLVILSVLPTALRRRTAVAAAADYFFARGPRATASALLGAFPFHRHGPVATSLAHCRDLAADGHSLLIFPEGTRSPDGRLLPFKPGIGLLARELGLPVLPIHLDGLHAILPRGRRWPRPGAVTVSLGRPLVLRPDLSNAAAAARLEHSVRSLGQPPRPTEPAA